MKWSVFGRNPVVCCSVLSSGGYEDNYDGRKFRFFDRVSSRVAHGRKYSTKCIG
jgi:hypothetical protein